MTPTRFFALAALFALFTVARLGAQHTALGPLSEASYATGVLLLKQEKALAPIGDLEITFVEYRAPAIEKVYSGLVLRARALAPSPNAGVQALSQLSTNEMHAVGSQLNTLLDEVLDAPAEEGTTFQLRGGEGFGVVGAYRDGAWRTRVTLGMYDGSAGAPLDRAQLEALTELIVATHARHCTADAAEHQIEAGMYYSEVCRH